MYKLVKIYEGTDIRKFLSYVGQENVGSVLFPYIQIKHEKIFELCLIGVLLKVGLIYVLDNNKIEEFYEKQIGQK